MFKKIAEAKHHKAAIRVLRHRIPEMDLETPKVLLQGEVADSIQALLKVADPYDAPSTDEWKALWQRITEAQAQAQARAQRSDVGSADDSLEMTAIKDVTNNPVP